MGYMKLEPRSNVKVMFATVGSGVKRPFTDGASNGAYLLIGLGQEIKKRKKLQAPSFKQLDSKNRIM